MGTMLPMERKVRRIFTSILTIVTILAVVFPPGYETAHFARISGEERL